MSAAKTPRPRRVAGLRPSSVPSGRPRKVADGRRQTMPATEPEAAPAPAPEPAVTEAPPPPVSAAEQEPPVTGEEPSRSRPRTITVVLAALTVVAAVVVGLLAWDVLRMDARADARKAGQLVAAESVETILSYDHTTYDKGVAASQELMTDGFTKKYAETIETVRPEVLRTKSVVKAEVVAASVVSAEDDTVRSLLFVNQTTTGEQVDQPRVDLNRVVVTLERGDDGTWLVADIDAL